MKYEGVTAIIGAGPYGLSVAAHLKARGVPTKIFGKPMEFWENMPSGMHLKSVWSASSLADPASEYTLQQYVSARKTTKLEPVPLPFFIDYGQWFQERTVPDVDPTYVQSLARDGNGFHLDLADGRSLKAQKVIVASGIAAFASVPDFARDLPITLASHTQFHKDFAQFKGRKTAVLGGGQSGLQTAAFLHEIGADVELIVRGPVRWHNHTLYNTGPLRRVFYTSADVGPPGINWLVASPFVFSRFPEELKTKIHKRAIRPGGAAWLRPRVEGQIRVTENTHIVKAKTQDQMVSLELSDGTLREVEYLFLGTGYRANVEKLAFIDPVLQKQIHHHDGYPVLNEWFESSVPHLHFAGALAGRTFGPICRFVSGAKYPARQITQHAVQAV